MEGPAPAPWRALKAQHAFFKDKATQLECTVLQRGLLSSGQRPTNKGGQGASMPSLRTRTLYRQYA